MPSVGLTEVMVEERELRDNKVPSVGLTNPLVEDREPGDQRMDSSHTDGKTETMLEDMEVGDHYYEMGVVDQDVCMDVIVSQGPNPELDGARSLLWSWGKNEPAKRFRY